MKKTTSGFTIVELLIVVVVIAILAAISVVAFSGIQNRASNAAIHSEATQWRKLFEAYRAVNGTYPSPVASGDPLTSGGPGANVLDSYCLGTGFPQSNGTSYCYVVSSASVYRVEEATGTYLLTQLSTIGTPPANTKKYIYNTLTGPMLEYFSASNVRIWSIFPGGTSCSSMSMLAGYGDSGRQDCYYSLT